jgi:hypothetical protein
LSSLKLGKALAEVDGPDDVEGTEMFTLVANSLGKLKKI